MIEDEAANVPPQMLAVEPVNAVVFQICDRLTAPHVKREPVGWIEVSDGCAFGIEEGEIVDRSLNG
jgi:hypothetical protein